MSKFTVKVAGGKPPSKSEGALRRLALAPLRAVRGVLMRPRLVLTAGIAGFVLLVGTPHAGWDYGCNHPTRGLATCRSVAWCAYYGVQGRRVELPAFGERCKLVTFLPMDWDRLGDDVRDLASSFMRES